LPPLFFFDFECLRGSAAAAFGEDWLDAAGATNVVRAIVELD